MVPSFGGLVTWAWRSRMAEAYDCVIGPDL